MSRRLLWTLPLLAAACTGLYFDRGNAFPCDFSQGPGMRDSACVAGDVCGSNNVCQKYIYEGPRFENGASMPTFGADTTEGAVIHPLVLTKNIDAVSAELPVARAGSNWAFTQSNLVEVTRSGRVLAPFPQFDAVLPLLANASPRYLQPFFAAPGPTPTALAIGLDGGFVIVPPLPLLPRNVNVIAGELRLVDSPWSADLVTPVAFRDDSLGFVVHAGNDWRFAPIGEVSAAPEAPFLDVAGIRLPQRLWLIALRNDSATVLSVVAPTDDANPGDAGVATDAGVFALTPLDRAVGGVLRSDREGHIVTAVRRTQLPTDGGTPLFADVLTTWQVTIEGTEPKLVRAWPDCRPCPKSGQTVRMLSASVATGVPTVEVICDSPTAEPATLRVKGSVALTQAEGCLTETFDSPIPFARFARSPASFWQNQTGLLVGGPNGAMWSGETISGLRPAFLDRVPVDVTTVQTPTGSTLAAITSDSLTVQQSPDLLAVPRGERANGFRRISARELSLPDDTRLLSFVRDTPGWGVTSRGDVIKTLFNTGGVKVFPGPHLVSSNGQPILGSIGGEAFVSGDKLLQGFFVAADDSVYFVKNPRQFITDVAGDLPTLPPDLTPEPSVPIRSLALERTPLGTDGIGRGRGYLVTSRNVYEWRLENSRWSSTQVPVGGGEPMEVWFDAPTSALGRVGFRNGEVFTLPGGYQLTFPLDAAGDVSAQVSDYENLGGWPVAYAKTGLFIASWDKVGDKLQNRFEDGGINRPMTWREVTLPDGGRPWMQALKAETRPGKLFVTKDAPDGGQPQHLLLFLDEQVIQVASTVRQ